MKRMLMLMFFALLFTLYPACQQAGDPPEVEDRSSGLDIQANLVFFYYPDLVEAERFYGEVLGLEKVLDYGFARIFRISQSTYIGLVDEERGMHKPGEPKTVTLSFVTDQIDGWYDYLVAQGVPMRGPLKDATRHATRGFVAYDPAGYFLEFERFLIHPENERLYNHLQGVLSVFPDPEGSTSRPSSLGIKASVIWLYYRDIPRAQRFYRDVFGASLLVEQAFAWIYSCSASGFIGLVDESQGLHCFTEEKAVNVSFLSDRIDEWYARFQEFGVPINEPLETASSIPVRAFVAYDPAGYFIEFDSFLDDPRNERLLSYLK